MNCANSWTPYTAYSRARSRFVVYGLPPENRAFYLAKIALHVNYVQNRPIMAQRGAGMKQNITLSLDSETLQQARELAAGRKLSISRLLAQDLSQQVEAERHYQQAQRQALAWLNGGGLELGGDYLTRDAAHER